MLIWTITDDLYIDQANFFNECLLNSVIRHCTFKHFDSSHITIVFFFSYIYVFLCTVLRVLLIDFGSDFIINLVYVVIKQIGNHALNCTSMMTMFQQPRSVCI